MISIIVPAYNSQEHLRQCIDSIIGQTLVDWDLILVDDGSTDSTGAICDEYAAKDSRIRVIHQPNAGVSAARNAALKSCRGEYVAFCDSDDMLMPTCLETLMQALLDHDASIAACDFIHGKKAPKYIKNIHPKSSIAIVYAPKEAVEEILYQKGLNTSCSGKLFRRECLGMHPFCEGLRFEDLYAIHHIVLCASGNIVRVPQRLYFYRDNPKGYINSTSEDRFDVLSVTQRIEDAYRGIPRLEKAARDRRFSANYNTLLLCRRIGRKDMARQCAALVRSRAMEVLLNPHSRIKNRLGALVAWLL